MSLPLLVYVVIVALSVVLARDANLAGFQLFLLVQAFLLYLYVLHSVRCRQDILFIVTMLMISLILVSLTMIGVRFVGHNISVGNISARIDSFLRVSGTFGSPNAAAAYLTLMLAPALSVLLSRVRSEYKWLAAVGFTLGSVALVLTFSRGSWISFIVSVAILCLLAWRRGWLSPTLPIIVIAVIATLTLFSPLQDLFFARLFGDDGGSAQSRVPLIWLAFRMIRDHPVLGVGANNFAIMIERYANSEFSRNWLYTVHNQYLLVWAETGIIGLVAFISLLFTVLRRGWQGWRANDRFLSPLALAFTAAILGHLLHMFVDFFNQRPQVQLLWLIAGLVTAIHITAENANDASEASFSVKGCSLSLNGKR
jgi:O-antigen ligase